MHEANDIHILGIVGSPRRNGNTETLVDKVLEGAKVAGAKTEKFILNEMDISPCQACDACKGHDECKHFEDDMNELQLAMEESEVFVFGTPVYWWGPTAQFKAFMDRWFALSKDVFKEKRVIIVMPLGASSAHYARHAIGMITDSCEYVGLNVLEKIIATGVYEKGEVAEKPKILSQAREAGVKLVQET